MGKTLIDTALRNDIIDFLQNADYGLDSGDQTKSDELLNRLKPKKRGRKKVPDVIGSDDLVNMA